MNPPRAAGLSVLGEWRLTPQRLAIHEPTGTAVVADVHLGYAAARRAAGDAVPLRPADATLAPLREAYAQFGFRALVVAGDLFERAFAADEYAALLEMLRQHDVRWLGLVPGNHDRRALRGTSAIPVLSDGLALSDWRVVHGDGEPAEGKCVLGHWHPCVRRGSRKYPCYLVGPDRLVLPAYSADAAGVDVDRDRRWDAMQRVAIVGSALTSAV